MSSTNKVVTKNRRLYEVKEYEGTFYVSNSKANLGKAKSLDTALALIRSHSGSDIEQIY